MKTLITLAISLLVISCSKKDWNCTCTVNGKDYQKTITHTTKTTASSDCNDYGKSIGQSYGNYTSVCKVN